MNKIWTLFLIICFPALLYSQDEMNSLLDELDATLDKSEFYHNKKEAEMNN